MAIFGAVPPPGDNVPTSQEPPQTPSHPLHPGTSTTPIDIEAWTLSALQSLSVSPIARGTGSPLAIPLDEAVKQKKQEQDGLYDRADDESPAHRTVTIAVGDGRKDPIRRPPSRRDSMKRREAALKGNEGSRQRRRWENDRLVHVPNVQPPLPSDFAPQATHPVHRVPYHLAVFWDREPADGRSLHQRQSDKHLAQQARRKKAQVANGSATGLGAGMVPRDLRDCAKRSPAVRNWVRHLEEPVRDLVREQNEAEARARASADVDTDVEGLDSEDEEIVFVGRRNQMPAAPAAGPGWKRAARDVGRGRVESGVVFDELGDDDSAAFKRWLTHAISAYYGLESRSVTTGAPARRVVYVGITGPAAAAAGARKPRERHFWTDLPRPLWEVC